MEYFSKYTSNTIASSGNQLFFAAKEDEVKTGRAFYKITAAGRYNYSLLFTNTIDSTYSDGSVSRKNTLCGNWKILGMRAAVCDIDLFECDFFDSDNAEKLNSAIEGFVPITFSGASSKNVAPGEVFCTDPFSLSIAEGEYLCVEITFCGNIMPYHEESLLPIFAKRESGWIYDKTMPLPAMVGCDREVKGRIGYVGDSITQGIGVPVNAYTHWNAVFSQKLGNGYAHWNLGLGFARADDMASLGAWAEKAMNNDILFVCFGVNDMLQGFSAQDIKNSLATIVRFFKKNGKKVILQTLPPFDYSEQHRIIWNEVNDYIKNELSAEVDGCFDNVSVLGDPKESHKALYGGHPNEQGCAVWAEKLYEAYKEI